MFWDCSKHFELLSFLHRKLSFLATFHASRGARGEAQHIKTILNIEFQKFNLRLAIFVN